MKEFEKELKDLINKYSIENECNMSDFLLAEMLVNIIKGISNPIKRCLDCHECDSSCTTTCKQDK